MIKPFHLLTDEEWKALEENPDITWEFLGENYPQPEWCSYPDATLGMFGCFSLMDRLVKNENYCKNCECYKPKTA